MFRIFLFLLLAPLSVIANEQCINDHNQMPDLKQWQGEGVYQLPKSNSTLSVPSACLILIGEEANQNYILLGGQPNPAIEAIVYSTIHKSLLTLAYNEIGYISLDDWYWDCSDCKKLVDEVELENESRILKGLEEKHMVWLKKPLLNRDTNTAYSTMELFEGTESVVISVAMHLGRKGFEVIQVISPKSSHLEIEKNNNLLETIINNHKFNPGYDYQDYTSGDKVANYGWVANLEEIFGVQISNILLKIIGLMIGFCIALIFLKLGYLLIRFKDLFIGKKDE